MARSNSPTRRRVLLAGSGLTAAALGGWLAQDAFLRDAAAPVGGAAETPVKRLNWSDLRPREAEAAALRDRIEARRRGELGLPSEQGANPMAGPSGHQDALASDWIDGAAFDTSPAADAPFSWGQRRPPRAEELVSSLDRLAVALPGYAVPLDAELDSVTSFLLAPYVGACIHVPPPPANQLVLVTSDTPHRFKEMFEPIVVTGEMRVAPASSRLADAGYQIRAKAIRRFDAEKEGAAWRQGDR